MIILDQPDPFRLRIGLTHQLIELDQVIAIHLPLTSIGVYGTGVGIEHPCQASQYIGSMGVLCQERIGTSRIDGSDTRLEFIGAFVLIEQHLFAQPEPHTLVKLLDVLSLLLIQRIGTVEMGTTSQPANVQPIKQVP